MFFVSASGATDHTAENLPSSILSKLQVLATTLGHLSWVGIAGASVSGPAGKLRHQLVWVIFLSLCSDFHCSNIFQMLASLMFTQTL